ncbi:MAG: glucose 1-dehydrogenase [Candidatus Thorarchaeota archaeon]
MPKDIMDMCFGIKGHNAIVTGASSGLGVDFTEALAQAGANVVIAARRYERLVENAEQIMEDNDVRIVPVEADVTKEDQVINMVDTAVEEFGSLEIMVNNAGISAMVPSVDMALEEWKKVIDVNLTGVFLTARTAARKMIEQEYGKMINIASIYGAVGDRFHAAPYYASKAAVINLTRAFAIEWAPHSINVNAIAPGFFPSEMTEDILDDEQARQLIKSRTALGRVGDPFDLQGALIYLASPASDYMTGETLFIDGGWTAL